MRFLSLLLALLSLGFLMMGPGCANIVPPGGGPKDTSAPRLLSVVPADSQFNLRPQKIDLSFNEYVVLNDPGTQVQISPMLEVPLVVTNKLRNVTIRVADTLLRRNTTYRISFGDAIRDLHEGNPFRGYSYVFSTGSYFDSLRVSGHVEDAALGLPDTTVLVMLYDAADGDSAVVRKKPLYIVHADEVGNFRFDGLPAGEYYAYALADKNSNYIYDGPEEKIAFLDSSIRIAPGPFRELQLYSFTEPADTALNGTQPDDQTNRGNTGKAGRNEPEPARNFSYSIGADSSDLRKRTFDITQPLRITFTRPLREVAESRIFLSYDSAGTVIETGKRVRIDTTNRAALLLESEWREDMVYTLRLLKGFAKDTAATEAMPTRFSFHTKRDEDYGKLQLHLPTRMQGGAHVLQVMREKDTFYQKPVVDTMITFSRLAPGNYSFRIIHDDNRNGKWDPGDLFLKRQPEKVEAYPNTVLLKAGWENLIDFEERKAGKGAAGENRGKAAPR